MFPACDVEISLVFTIITNLLNSNFTIIFCSSKILFTNTFPQELRFDSRGKLLRTLNLIVLDVITEKSLKKLLLAQIEFDW